MALQALGMVTPLSLSHVALAGLLAAGVAYVLYFRSRSSAHAPDTPDSATVIKPARRLSLSPAVVLRLLRVLRHPEEIPELVLKAALAFGEQPWLRSLPFFPDVLMISSPALLEDVVKTQRARFVKSELFRDITQETVGGAFFTLEGTAWLHQRKIASRFFAPRIYRDVATATIQRHADKLFGLLHEAARAHEPVNLTRVLHGFTFQAFADLGFGLQTGTLDSHEPHALERVIDAAFSQTIYRVLVPPWLWKLQRFLNVGSERTYAANTTEIRRIVGELVHESIAVAQQQDRPATTLVELFIDAMRDGEVPFSPELLCDLAVMFMIAGRDTTAGTLNWVLYALDKHPDVADTIRAELAEKVPGFADGTVPSLTMEEAHSLTYLEAAIKETMRLYPIVPLTLRSTVEDTVLVDGTFVAKGTVVGMSPYVTGRLPSVWGDDVLAFKPERFMDPATGKLRAISACEFFGFLAGPRICIGMTLAMLEMKLVVAGLLRRFRFETTPNDGSYRVSAMMQLKEPLMVHVHVAEPALAS